MEWVKKNIWWLLCTVALGLLCFVCAMFTQPDPLRFSVVSASGVEEITVFEDESNLCYVFLPSYAEMGQVYVRLETNQRVTINGVVLTNGMSCNAFSLDTDYTLNMQNKKYSTIRFCQSSGVATMYVETESGKMDYINRDKSHSESISVVLYNKDGRVDYSGSDATLSGRGNATWECSKKPYLLTLKTDADLLHMGAATEWVLLANAMDPTNLKNKLVLDMAKECGASWSPDCVFVDVYLNGEYSGLYLLAEKVDASENRLGLNEQAGEFLGLFELDYRWDALSNPFITNAHRVVEIRHPLTVTAQEQERIRNLVNAMEGSLLSGEDLGTAENIELDSWVHRYIIDEISANIDADRGSVFFYYQNGRFHGGPVWDYDMTFGNVARNMEPVAFVARNKNKSKLVTAPYYSVLCQNESFNKRTSELFSEMYLPYLTRLLDGGIQDYADKIEDAVKMNLLRWPAVNEEDPIYALENYLSDRKRFLIDVWLENKEYCTVYFEHAPNDFYHNISVEKGDILQPQKIDIENTVWLVEETGEPFDFSQTIHCDMVLIKQPTTQQNTTPVRDARIIVVWLSIFATVLFMLILTLIDIYHRRKEKRSANE